MYSLRWDVLYLTESLIVIAVSGWSYLTSDGAVAKALSVDLAGQHSVCHRVGSDQYRDRARHLSSGGLADIPFVIALLVFFWAALSGRRCLRETQATPSGTRRHRPLCSAAGQGSATFASRHGILGVVCGLGIAYLRQVRFTVAMGGVAVLAFFVFLKQHLLDRRLVQLLLQSRSSYDNLQRLQGRVVQQAKLASLGELVALAASELEYPLATVLEEFRAPCRQQQSDPRTTFDRAENRSAGTAHPRPGQRSAELCATDSRRKISAGTEAAASARRPDGGFQTKKRDINLAVQSDEIVPRVLGNSNQLLQAFLQVVENAVDALQEAGGGKLLVSLRHEGNEVVIEFADSGPGLRDPERVFDPFYTTKPVGKGTGLGLSATYGVVQDHKGQITCYNRPEGGAAFEIRLPAMRVGSPFTEAARA